MRQDYSNGVTIGQLNNFITRALALCKQRTRKREESIISSVKSQLFEDPALTERKTQILTTLSRKLTREKNRLDDEGSTSQLLRDSMFDVNYKTACIRIHRAVSDAVNSYRSAETAKKKKPSSTCEELQSLRDEIMIMKNSYEDVTSCGCSILCWPF